MDELVAFLRARYDDDERVARAAKPGPWHVEDDRQDLTRWVTNEARSLEVGLGYVGNRTQADAAHIAGHDPARVLRAVEAKRQILRDLANARVALSSAESGTPPHDLMTGAVNLLELVVRRLAAVDDEHPDYREEWRP